MAGIELSNFLRFLMQAGAALTGASALWGSIFLYRTGRGGANSQGFRGLGSIALRTFCAGFAVFISSWFLLSFAFSSLYAHAHEGITLGFSAPYFLAGLDITAPLVALISLSAFLLVTLPRWRRALFFANFVLISAFMLFATYTGELDTSQIYYSLHHFHSILTVGTVIFIDILYLSTIRNDSFKRALYPFFPILSSAIWIGLGLDFLSVALISPESAVLTSQFIFNQMVIGIIIVNGALLSGRINEHLISLIEPGKVSQLTTRMDLIFGLSGAVSVVSWVSITFLDFFTLPFSLPVLAAVYISAISLGFLVHASSRLLLRPGLASA